MRILDRTKIAGSLAIALIGLSPCEGEAALSLQDCISRVSSNSVQITQSVVNTARAQAALEEASKPQLPQIVAQGNLATSSDLITQATDSNKAVIRIEQGTLPFFGSAWQLASQRSAELEVAKLSQVESEQDVHLIVKQLYFSILKDEDSIKNSNLVEEEFKRLLAAVIPRFQINRGPSFDLVKVRSAIYDLARAREILRSQLLGEKSQLAQILGLKDLNYVLVPPPNVPNIPETPSLVGANPTLNTLIQSVNVSRAAESVSSSARIPSLSAAVEYGLTGQSPNTLLNTWNVFAQLRLTIFDWGLISTQVRQAEAATILAEKKLESEMQRISSDLVQTRALAEAHLADQKRLQKLIPELKSASNVSLERYRRAAVTIIEATDSISLWLQNLMNERAAYYGYLSDLAHLERVTGEKTKVDYGI